MIFPEAKYHSWKYYDNEKSNIENFHFNIQFLWYTWPSGNRFSLVGIIMISVEAKYHSWKYYIIKKKEILPKAFNIKSHGYSSPIQMQFINKLK